MEKRLTGPKILFMSGVIFMILVGLWLVLGALQNTAVFYTRDLGDGWTVFVDGQQVVSADEMLDEYNIGRKPRGTQIDLYYDLGPELDGNNTIQIIVYLSAVRAYVDDELIYSYGYDEYLNNQMVGSGYHFINLPESVNGKQLHVNIITNEKNAFTSFFAPVSTYTKDVIRAFASREFLNVVISIFIAVLGVVLILSGIIASLYNQDYLDLALIGGFAVAMGVWSFCTNKLFHIFAFSMTTSSQLEYLCLYFAPIPFSVLVWFVRKGRKDWRNTMLKVIHLTLSAFFVISTVLNFTNIVRYPTVLTLYHVLGGIMICLLFFAGFISVKDKTHSEITMTIAIVELMVSIGLDLIRFNIHKYLFPGVQNLNYSFLPLGTLGFVLLLILSYLISIYDFLMTKAEKETLTRLAYTDALTGMGNRARYNSDIKELDDKGEAYAIINLDVNGLKYVNDTFGHEEGDILLKEFGNVITNVFTAVGDCYRIGGDEFIVIVKPRYFSAVDFALRRLSEAEAEITSKHDYDITASYGVARTDEIEDANREKVYFLADQRMYKMKQNFHKDKNINS